MDGAAGETTIEVRLAAACVTVKVAVALSAPDFAEIVDDPAAEAVASPPALMLATVPSDEPHCTELVMSLLVPSDM